LLAAVFEADQRGPERNAAYEVPRAIDGIGDPPEAARAGRFTGFLAEEAIGRKLAQQQGAQPLLRLSVRDGDGRLVRLPLDIERPVEVFERQLPGLLGSSDGQIIARSPCRIQPWAPFRVSVATESILPWLIVEVDAECGTP